MAEPQFYRWRTLTDSERNRVLTERRSQQRPWHSPPHGECDSGTYLITAACYEHSPLIGQSIDRMEEFSMSLLATCEDAESKVYSWVVLPNHYHILLANAEIRSLLKSLGRLHGRTSYQWNGEEGLRGRKVWFNAAETGIRSERHFWATHLYVLNNPVKHRYVQQWQDWPFSNAVEWLESTGRDRAVAMWREFPIDDYGAEWDPPDL